MADIPVQSMTLMSALSLSGMWARLLSTSLCDGLFPQELPKHVLGDVLVDYDIDSAS